MVILIASENADASHALAEGLARGDDRRIFTAATMEDLDEAAASLEELDVLLFSAAFNKGRGKEVRDSLRSEFPGLQAVLISNEQGQCAPLEKIADWLERMENPELAGVSNAVSPVILGDYELKEKRRTSATTESFLAVQRSVNREVVLERLKPELQSDKAAVRAFREMVKARANVSCPWIATVYEVQETAGTLFYTRELIRGLNLDELAAARARVTPEESLQLLKAAGEAMTWYAEKAYARGPLKRHHIYHGTDGVPRIANTALTAAAPLDEPAEIRPVAEALMRVTDFRAGPAREISHVLGLMKAVGPHALTSWRSVLRESRAAFQRLTEARTSSLAGQRDTARPRRRKSRGPLVAGIIIAVAGAGTAVAWFNRHNKPAPPKSFAFQAHVPAGEFIYRDGEHMSLPDFWIDSHEVTIGQYAEFLSAIPGDKIRKFDHEKQPAGKTGHEPGDWQAIYHAALTGGSWNGYPVSLNCPVFNVDWWDASAYASWKGRRLPKEPEWEKAARGTNGRQWPWGSEPDLKRANTGADYAEQPGSVVGATDGHVWWCEVDAMPQDVSPYGVVGMAGNVSEWVDLLVTDPDLPDVKVPVFRGGDFRRESAAAITTPWLAKSPTYAQPFLGFRTVSSSPPQK